jgi:uracil-DNA glycosylase
MRPCELVACSRAACGDVRRECLSIPDFDFRPEQISAILISECAPPDPADYYYAGGGSLFERTTVQAFRDAGADVKSVGDIVRLGFYLTTAVKCAKTGYAIDTATIKECSLLLDRELALFPNVKAYLLMGDVAIRSINYIAARAGEKRVIPAGSTYKIRGPEYRFRDGRAFPSYLQAGPSFFIEKVKRAMIAQDIGAALALVSG